MLQSDRSCASIHGGRYARGRVRFRSNGGSALKMDTAQVLAQAIKNVAEQKWLGLGYVLGDSITNKDSHDNGRNYANAKPSPQYRLHVLFTLRHKHNCAPSRSDADDRNQHSERNDYGIGQAFTDSRGYGITCEAGMLL
jgi:hypothetical protein